MGSPGLRLHLVLYKGAFVPGERVVCTVQLYNDAGSDGRPGVPADIKQLVVSSIGQERTDTHWVRRLHRPEVPPEQTGEPRKNVRSIYKTLPMALLQDTRVPPGACHQFQARFRLPDILPPTFKGQACRFSYQLQVRALYTQQPPGVATPVMYETTAGTQLNVLPATISPHAAHATNAGNHLLTRHSLNQQQQQQQQHSNRLTSATLPSSELPSQPGSPASRGPGGGGHSTNNDESSASAWPLLGGGLARPSGTGSETPSYFGGGGAAPSQQQQTLYPPGAGGQGGAGGQADAGRPFVIDYPLLQPVKIRIKEVPVDWVLLHGHLHGYGSLEGGLQGGDGSHMGSGLLAESPSHASTTVTPSPSPSVKSLVDHPHNHHHHHYHHHHNHGGAVTPPHPPTKAQQHYHHLASPHDGTAPHHPPAGATGAAVAAAAGHYGNGTAVATEATAPPHTPPRRPAAPSSATPYSAPSPIGNHMAHYHHAGGPPHGARTPQDSHHYHPQHHQHHQHHQGSAVDGLDDDDDWSDSEDSGYEEQGPAAAAWRRRRNSRAMLGGSRSISGPLPGGAMAAAAAGRHGQGQGAGAGAGAQQLAVFGHTYTLKLREHTIMRVTLQAPLDSTVLQPGCNFGGLVELRPGGLAAQPAMLCHQLNVLLESEEVVPAEFSTRGAGKQPGVMRKLLCEHQELTSDMAVAQFLFSVPVAATPSFETPIVALRWVLRFELTVGPPFPVMGLNDPVTGASARRGPLEALSWSLPILVHEWG